MKTIMAIASHKKRLSRLIIIYILTTMYIYLFPSQALGTRIIKRLKPNFLTVIGWGLMKSFSSAPELPLRQKPNDVKIQHGV